MKPGELRICTSSSFLFDVGGVILVTGTGWDGRTPIVQYVYKGVVRSTSQTYVESRTKLLESE